MNCTHLKTFWGKQFPNIQEHDMTLIHGTNYACFCLLVFFEITISAMLLFHKKLISGKNTVN